ncbi:unnamed protein product [Pleuronectes platessa]|uniref:Uncharacterized protein n=1 Tax=Pleuronectes platessa TaxID=8262 RepID=A0A9N7YQB2_PLEPL|nr:unnamed protein product [Pleuronectes platessa]
MDMLSTSGTQHQAVLLERISLLQAWIEDKHWVSQFVLHLVEVQDKLKDFLFCPVLSTNPYLGTRLALEDQRRFCCVPHSKNPSPVQPAHKQPPPVLGVSAGTTPVPVSGVPPIDRLSCSCPSPEDPGLCLSSSYSAPGGLAWRLSSCWHLSSSPFLPHIWGLGQRPFLYLDSCSSSYPLQSPLHLFLTGLRAVCLRPVL